MVGQMRFRPFQWSQLDKLTTQLSDNPEDLIETDGRSGCATAVPHKQELRRTEIVVWSNGNLNLLYPVAIKGVRRKSNELYRKYNFFEIACIRKFVTASERVQVVKKR